MSTHAFALASQFAALPAVQEVARSLVEPSTAMIVGVAAAVFLIGRKLSGSPSQD